MSQSDLAADVARLDSQVAQAEANSSPDDVLCLALALEQQHNSGDLARAADLLDPIVKATAPELEPWQPMARLLAASIAEQRKLEDLAERFAAQRRDTQRTIQQLTEKLEALKAIERSMTSRGSGATAPLAPAAASGVDSTTPRSP